MQVLQYQNPTKSREAKYKMTPTKFVSYQSVLQQRGFTFTGRLTAEMQPPNWQRHMADAADIQRVWLASDGSFKAYNGLGLILCHGHNAAELASCI
jgi:hypothetical protein